MRGMTWAEATDDGVLELRWDEGRPEGQIFTAGRVYTVHFFELLGSSQAAIVEGFRQIFTLDAPPAPYAYAADDDF